MQVLAVAAKGDGAPALLSGLEGLIGQLSDTLAKGGTVGQGQGQGQGGAAASFDCLH